MSLITDQANTEQLIYDLDLDGGVDFNGGLKEVWGNAALSNSIKLWIASFEGDMLRDVNRGGYIRPFLEKPMSIDRANKLVMLIRDGFYQDFTPYMEILELSIIPDLNKKLWSINMRVYSRDFKTIVEINENIKGRV